MEQNIAGVATDLWPSISSAFQTPWRSAQRVATPQSTKAARTVSIPNQISASSIQSRSYSTSNAQSRSNRQLPECLVNVDVASLRSRIQPVVLGSAPTTMGIFGSSMSRQVLVDEMKGADVLLVSKSALSQCSPISRRLPQFAMNRQYSTATKLGPFTLRSLPRTSQLNAMQRRNATSSNASFQNLSRMEQTANNNPGSASSQNAFYSALLRAGRPDLVVQRYETNNFATNPACDVLYNRALERVGNGQENQTQGQSNLRSEQQSAVAQAVAARHGQGSVGEVQSGTGAKDQPFHVLVSESIGTRLFGYLKFFLWFSFAAWTVYILTTMLFEGAGMLRKASGKENMEAKPEAQKARFSDVHGCDEAKEELQELVEFLKDPAKFSTLGGKLPKGVLLTGPPGTGKTLLARAVAGEAGVPFFYMSGSEFDEVYVGVGAKRVRELFQAATAKAPAIVFIDELDAIGGKRNERDHAYAKQTLNQLLTELDGFDQSNGVIFLAATNFPESLDKALVRPGRFDRQVPVPLPDVRGRVAILNHHTKKMQMGTDVDTSLLARGTPGFSGADLENLVNQAAVNASKRKSQKVHMLDLEYAKDKLLMGAERRSAVITQKAKMETAYHEGGHTLVALYSPHADPLYKATIMPRGHALGITFMLPEMDRVSMAKREYLAHIDVCMGGKVAEEMYMGEEAVTSGASSDIQSATRLAYDMVARFGMSEKIGNVDVGSSYRDLSPKTKDLIWEEVRRIVEDSKKRAETILHSRRKELDLLAQGLVDYETLNKEEIEKIVKGEKLEGKMKASEGPMKMPEFKGRPPGGLPQPVPLPPSEPSGTPPPPSGGGGGLGVPGPIPGATSRS